MTGRQHKSMGRPLGHPEGDEGRLIPGQVVLSPRLQLPTGSLGQGRIPCLLQLAGQVGNGMEAAGTLVQKGHQTFRHTHHLSSSSARN